MEGLGVPGRAEPSAELPGRPLSCPPVPAGPNGGAVGDRRYLAGLYLIGALSAEQARSYERHLLHCPACQADCDRIGPAIDVLATLRPGDAARLAAQGVLPADGR